MAFTAAAGLDAGQEADARTVAGVSLPENLHLSSLDLVLRSCGVRQTLWIEHYVAALYVPAAASAGAAVRDAQVPKAMRIEVIDSSHFPHDLPAEWRRPLKQTLSAREFNRVSAAYDRLRSGDVMLFAYSPGDGLIMSVNGQVLVHRAGHGVIDAMLTAWDRGEAHSGALGQLLYEHQC